MVFLNFLLPKWQQKHSPTAGAPEPVLAWNEEDSGPGFSTRHREGSGAGNRGSLCPLLLWLGDFSQKWVHHRVGLRHHLDQVFFSKHEKWSTAPLKFVLKFGLHRVVRTVGRCFWKCFDKNEEPWKCKILSVIDTAFFLVFVLSYVLHSSESDIIMHKSFSFILCLF